MKERGEILEHRPIKCDSPVTLLSDLNIDKRTSSRSQKIAMILIEMKERGEVSAGGDRQSKKHGSTPVTMLSDLNIDRRMSSSSQKIASIPEDN